MIEESTLQQLSFIEQKMRALLDKKTLNIKLSKHSAPTYNYSDVFNDKNSDRQTLIHKLIDIGQLCKGIIIRKDENTKELIIHLTKIILNQVKENNTQSYKYLQNNLSNMPSVEQIFINKLKILCFIKDYDLKQTFSIFTYINSYKDIKIGSQVCGILTRKQKRNHHQQQILYYQMSIKNQIWNPRYKNTPRYGIKFDERFKEVVDQEYLDKQNISLSKLILYSEGFQNSQIINSLSKNLDVELNENINPISNIKALKHLHINFQRIRQHQEKYWAKEHFNEGMELLKQGLNSQAIDCFDVAKRFDIENEKIYIGRSCALANMNNFSEGLKEIKEALKINPHNQQANQYYKIIREKLRQKESGPQMRKKASSNSSPRHNKQK